MDADMAGAMGPDYERNVLVWIDRLRRFAFMAGVKWWLARDRDGDSIAS
jgi:hypothetical protein